MTLSEAVEAENCETHTHTHTFPSDLCLSLMQLLQAQLIGKLLHYEKCLTNRLHSCNWITAAANSHCGDLADCMHTHLHTFQAVCVCVRMQYIYLHEWRKPAVYLCELNKE